jgi:charged multivesicular body protein 5
MEQAIMTTENLRNTMATVDAMKQANKEMSKQYSKIDIDKIEVSRHPAQKRIYTLILTQFHSFSHSIWGSFYQSISYDMEDLIEQANEVQESLGRSYGVPDQIDEDELQAGKKNLSHNHQKSHEHPSSILHSQVLSIPTF